MKLHWCWAGLTARLALRSFLLVVPILLFPRIAAGQGSNRGETAVVFYADPKVESSIWPSLVDAFHSETAREEGDYALPEDVELVRASALTEGQEFTRVIQVHLLGRCDVVQQAYRPIRRGPLGWVLRVSGEIQPFVYVDCTRLAQFLNPATLGMNDEQRRNVMTQAIARITIHEWIHIATQSAAHDGHGIRRAELSRDDLAPASRVSGGR